MFLTKLELRGFKSFVDDTNVSFGNGITAVVGPNGCGKTNISDAIRWVMGEQSAKQLRGEAMDDVIFNGSARRKPVGMAEVVLTMQNDKGILPTEYSEVEIGRRIYRSGVSEYLLNKQVVRLKDIKDLFFDTGMGSHAYSVIERSMVDNLLSDTTGHRRFLFEEASVNVSRKSWLAVVLIFSIASSSWALAEPRSSICVLRKSWRSFFRVYSSSASRFTGPRARNLFRSSSSRVSARSTSQATQPCSSATHGAGA